MLLSDFKFERFDQPQDRQNTPISRRRGCAREVFDVGKRPARHTREALPRGGGFAAWGCGADHAGACGGRAEADQLARCL